MVPGECKPTGALGEDGRGVGNGVMARRRDPEWFCSLGFCRFGSISRGAAASAFLVCDAGPPWLIVLSAMAAPQRGRLSRAHEVARTGD